MYTSFFAYYSFLQFRSFGITFFLFLKIISFTISFSEDLLVNSVFICMKRSSFIHSNFSSCSLLTVFPALYQWEPWMVYVFCPKIYICLFLAFYITLNMRLLVNFLTGASQTSLIMYIWTPNWCASSFVIINSQGRFFSSPQQKLRLRQTGFLVFSLSQWVFCFCFCFLVNPFIDYGFKKGTLHNLEGCKRFQCPTLLKPYLLVAECLIKDYKNGRCPSVTSVSFHHSDFQLPGHFCSPGISLFASSAMHFKGRFFLSSICRHFV